MRREIKSPAASLKTGYFVLEGLNAFATTHFFYYLFFFMSKVHGFGNRENLALAALNGLVYAFGAWWGGRFGQRFGYFRALQSGFGIMAAALAGGAFVQSVVGHVATMLACTVGMCLTWPNLEASVSEGETPHGLQRMVGLYNTVWAATGGLAFFIGGALLEALGLRSMFWIPASVHLLQLALLFSFQRVATAVVERGAADWQARPTKFKEAMHDGNSRCSASETEAGPPTLLDVPPPLNPRPIARARAFLKMAWLANPFAYVAVNTVVAVVPGLAHKLELRPAMAGVFCSIWLFSRLTTFWVLWLWQGWHYRFRWFISAYLSLTAGFAMILLLPALSLIIAGQIIFGIGLGLIYYSSLYYSMDVGEAKGEHGGFHEAAIGAGLCGGPAIGATALFIFPDRPDASAVAVSGLLVLGLFSLLAVRFRSRLS